MGLSKVFLFITGVALGGIVVQAIPFAVEWRRDYQSARAIERLKARSSHVANSPNNGVNARVLSDTTAANAAVVVKEYEAPFGSDVELRRWKLEAPEEIHRQIAAAMIAERGVKLDRAFNESAAAGARQSKHAIQEVELPNLRASISLMNKLIASTTQELIDLEVEKQRAIQRATSTAIVDRAVDVALAGDHQLKTMRAEQAKAAEQLAARKMASRDQQSVEIRLLQRQHDQLKSNVAARHDLLTKQAKQTLSQKPNEELRTALIEFQIRWRAAHSRLEEYRQTLDKANKRMLSLRRTLEAAEQPPTADSAI